MNLSANHIKKLKDIVGKDGVLTEEIDLTSYSFDASSRWKGNPEAVVFPTTTEQVAEIMKLATENSIPVTPRGAGSNLSGGSLPVKGGIVLCTTRMNKIVDIDTANFTATVEVGVVLNDLNRELGKRGLFFPPDPQSFLAATIGGCVAENAGGPYGVKYGVFRNYLLGMTIVLPKGDIVKLGGTTVKNVTGYDLSQLICGSEGTLAVITSVTLHLLPMPQARKTVLAVFDQVVHAGNAVQKVLEESIVPAKIELLDNWVIRRIEEMSPIGFPVDAEAILLFEMDGLQAAVEKETEEVIRVCKNEKARESRAAVDAKETENLWMARKAGFSAVFSLSPTVFAEDVTVPPSRIPELIEKVQGLCKKHDLTIVILGHAGDGNIHPSILTEMNDEEHYRRALAAMDDIFTIAISMGGAISGEHGIGLEKRKFLKDAMSAEAIDMLRKIKSVFDPSGILNPGKIWEEE
jgi:glycolate oxidase